MMASYFDLTPVALALVFDLIVVTGCSLTLLRAGRLAHSHPATIYLIFHAYTFTVRLAAIADGAPTLFTVLGWPFEPVAYGEIVRAALMGDAALIAITLACVKASRDDLRRNGPMPSSGQEGPADLSVKNIWRVVVVVFPIGVIGALSLANLPGREADLSFLGEWQTSSWLTITQTWAGLGVLALIYWYGFRRSLIVLVILFLLLMVYQGYHRFRVIIPLILLVQIYLDRRSLKWPSLRLAPLILVVVLLFYPLKTIGRLAQEGVSFTETANASLEIIQGAIAGQADDQTFLDQFASAVTLTDDNGRFFYGGTYLPILTLPIPKQFWPDKPGLADYLAEISRPWRPMKEFGMIVTLLGESYLNFGYVGLLVIPMLLAYTLSRAYFRAYRKNYYTAFHFAYLLVASNLLQVYRDGLSSLVVFTMVNMMPLMAIVILNRIAPARPEPVRVLPKRDWAPNETGASRV